MSQVRQKLSYFSYAQNREKQEHFGVGDYVYLPGAQAGPGRENWFEGQRVREEKKRIVLSGRVVFLYMITLILICSCCMVSKAGKRSAARKQQQQIVEQIRMENKAIEALEDQLVAIRDESRIGYLAAKQYGMIAPDENTVIEIYVPEVRAFAGTLRQDAGAAAVVSADMQIPDNAERSAVAAAR